MGLDLFKHIVESGGSVTSQDLASASGGEELLIGTLHENLTPRKSSLGT